MVGTLHNKDWDLFRLQLHTHTLFSAKAGFSLKATMPFDGSYAPTEGKVPTLFFFSFPFILLPPVPQINGMSVHGTIARHLQPVAYQISWRTVVMCLLTPTHRGPCQLTDCFFFLKKGGFRSCTRKRSFLLRYRKNIAKDEAE